MSERNWNRRQCVKICNWLSKRMSEQDRIVAELCPNGNAEIRLYETSYAEKPQLYINIHGTFDLIVDTLHKVGSRKCWCKSMLYDTIKEWYPYGGN